MKISKIAALILFIILAYFLAQINFTQKIDYSETEDKIWNIQSIDTMKYSRDPSREKLYDQNFRIIIDDQIKKIAETGVTHVAIATPYDNEFLPILKDWVRAARKYKLNVWFRGNFSGWEGWFGYKLITHAEHIEKSRQFILENPDLFADGDIFTACPECENGGSGDPRKTGKVNEYRIFLINEYQTTKNAFRLINKDVVSNYNSTNADVARLVYDKQTTQNLGGVVVIDHYVASTDQLVLDIKEIAKSSGGKIVLGEIGVPIPDIHGEMTEKEQSLWIEDALFKVSQLPEVIGVNYWVNVGGSSEIWSSDLKPKPSVQVLKNFYSPKKISILVKNELNKPISFAKISYYGKEYITNKKGEATILSIPKGDKADITSKGYNKLSLSISPEKNKVEVKLLKINEGFLFKIIKLFFNLLNVR